MEIIKSGINNPIPSFRFQFLFLFYLWFSHTHPLTETFPCASPSGMMTPNSVLNVVLAGITPIEPNTPIPPQGPWTRLPAGQGYRSQKFILKIIL